MLIEYKGYENKLVKLDENGNVENKNSKNEPHYSNIKNFAVNGAVCYVSKKNYGIGQEVGKFTDFSFLKKENFSKFIDEDVKKISLTEEEREK